MEKNQAQLYTSLVAKKPQQQQQQQQQTPLQDTTATAIKALTDKINRLKAGSSGGGGQGRSNKEGRKSHPSNGKDGIRVTKRWDNDNYCWLCGFNIKNTSMTC